MEIFDTGLLGASVENAQKLLLTMGLLVMIYVPAASFGDGRGYLS